MKRLTALIYLAMVATTAPAATLTFDGTDFASVNDGASTENIVIDVDGLSLDAVSNTLDLPGSAAAQYRGAVSFRTLDDNGPYWIEWSKDAAAAIGGGIFTSTDECLMADDLASLVSRV